MILTVLLKFHLTRDLTHNINWNAAVVIKLDQRQQVAPHRLKNHTDMCAIRTNMLKAIQQPYNIL